MLDKIYAALKELRAASCALLHCTDTQINTALLRIAELALEREADILAANAKDLARMEPADPKYDRLLLNPARLLAICADVRKVAGLPSPLGLELERIERPNGLLIRKRSVPLGVLGVVYESRPNVTFDVAALCLKSGNCVVLKGSRDAHDSNTAIAEIIVQALEECGLPPAVWLAPGEREALLPVIEAEGYIDAVIPRGSQGLIDYVRQHARVPVIETGAGIVHTYFDKSGDLEKGKAIITNAKARRVSVCNALDTLVIHKERLSDLSALLADLAAVHHCICYADAAAFEVLQPVWPADLLFRAEESHFGTEFLSMKMSVKTVDSIDAAIAHIAQYGSKHSECIVAEDEQAQALFLHATDAAVVYANASTAFTDGGEFGFGAEIGISTQKLHARGPMALREMTSYKWIVQGNGQVRY